MNENNYNGILDLSIIERGEVDHVVPISKLAVFEINDELIINIRSVKGLDIFLNLCTPKNIGQVPPMGIC